MQTKPGHHIAFTHFEKHRLTLECALQAIGQRDFWSAYSENPKNYPEQSIQQAQEAFDALLGKRFVLQGPVPVDCYGQECSPYGFDLGVRYDRYDVDDLLTCMQQALPAWHEAGAEVRTGICLEILHRLNQKSFEIALATMHTTGQAHIMAFQAGGPHAQDRGLEAIAYAWRAMHEVPLHTLWSKPQGKRPPIQLEKRWYCVPRGLSLLIGCATFPTWNTYPGLFASLMAGNPAVIKPHPGAILPLAMTIQVCQQVLEESGFDPVLVSLMVDTAQVPVSKQLALDKRVRLVDFTGSSAFGFWLENNARQAQVFTEKAGVNIVLLESVTNLDAVMRNMALTLSLYSGQMCTTPQLILIPEGGIRCNGQLLAFDEVVAALVQATQALLADPDRACMTLGAIQSSATVERIMRCRSLGKIVLDSRRIEHPQFANARVYTPLILKVAASEEDVYAEEQFGPVSFIVPTKNYKHSIQLASAVLQEKGALTLALYSTDEAVVAAAEVLAQEEAVSLSVNFDGSILPNQSAAFSDFHGSGANPAASAALTDSAFVTRRFSWIQIRKMLPAQPNSI